MNSFAQVWESFPLSDRGSRHRQGLKGWIIFYVSLPRIFLPTAAAARPSALPIKLPPGPEGSVTQAGAERCSAAATTVNDPFGWFFVVVLLPFFPSILFLFAFPSCGICYRCLHACTIATL